MMLCFSSERNIGNKTTNLAFLRPMGKIDRNCPRRVKCFFLFSTCQDPADILGMTYVHSEIFFLFLDSSPQNHVESYGNYVKHSFMKSRNSDMSMCTKKLQVRAKPSRKICPLFLKIKLIICN